MPILINASDPVPTVWVVKPDGNFYPAPLTPHTNDGVVTVLDGKPVIRPAALEKGYMFLHDAADSPAQLALLERYLDESRGNSRKVPLTDRALPKICKERRAANSPKAKEGFDFGEFADKPEPKTPVQVKAAPKADK